MAILISTTYGTVIDSSTPVTQSSYDVTKIINGNNGQTGDPGGWQYYQDGEVLSYPLYATIDLGADRPISEFRLLGLSHLWGGGSVPSSYNISIAPSKSAGGNPTSGDFEIVYASGMPSPTRGFNDSTWFNESWAAIPPQFARYVKITINNTFDPDSMYMGIGEFEIYSPDAGSIKEQSDLLSDAFISSITATTSTSILSSAYIFASPLAIEDIRTISSDAYILLYISEQKSDAEIYHPGMYISSDAFLSNTEATTILSNSHIQSTHYSFRGAKVLAVASGSLYVLPEYDLGDWNRSLVINTILNTTSNETIVPDIFTSTPLDVTDSDPPFGYQNYAWSYDWAARTYNNSTYYVATRYGDTLSELSIANYNVTTLGSRFERGNVPRYHQFRLHVWASGSGDFEFHQFTLRAHVNNTQNKYHKLLIDKPFLTTSIIDLDAPRTWEPDLDQSLIWSEDYLPGDINNDGIVNSDDVEMFYEWLILDTQDAPSDLRVADTNGDGSIDISDITYLSNYISGSGPPPRIRI